MSDHRIELRITFTVSDGTDGGREAAESVVRQLEYLAEHGQLDRETLDMEVVRGTVDGIGWYEKWPLRPEPVMRCGYLIEYSAHVIHGQLGAYRVSRDGQSNIIGEAFFKDLNAANDATFEEFMAAAMKPDFPHPFAVEAL